MSMRDGHGTGKGQPRIEVLPADQLPDPVRGSAVWPEYVNKKPPETPPGSLFFGAPSPEDDGPIEYPKMTYKGESGITRYRPTKSKKKFWTALAVTLTIPGIPPQDSSEFAPYKRAAKNFHRQHAKYLARYIGGDVCPPDAASMVGSASLQLARARYLQDRAEKEDDLALQAALFKQATTHENASRQNLLAAYEMAARQATTRDEMGSDPQAELAALLAG